MVSWQPHDVCQPQNPSQYGCLLTPLLKSKFCLLRYFIYETEEAAMHLSSHLKTLPRDFGGVMSRILILYSVQPNGLSGSAGHLCIVSL